MTGASKILTVSYGTFSCTLEGFDDPFNTMKAIAEYFRDLAADDRYFGAEPPTPDAAMLHRIAEREIHRRVEAKIQDNGVILRAGDSVADAPAPAPVLPSVHEADTDGVAARLQRIRARHANQAAAEAPALSAPPAPAPAIAQMGAALIASADQLDDVYTEDEHAEDIGAAIHSEPASDGGFEFDDSDQIDRILDAATAESVDIAGSSLLEAAAEADLTDEFADLPEAEEFDVSSITLTDIDDQTQLPAAEVLTSDDALLASLADEMEADLVPAAVGQDPAETDDDVAAFLPDNTPEPVIANAAAIETAAIETARVDGATDEDDILSRLSDLDIASEAKPFDEEVNVAAEDALIETIDQIDAEIAAPPAALAPAKPQKARARVIRIRRAETPTQPAVPQVADLAAPAAVAPISALSDEAEAALQAELAALEAELSGDLGIDLNAIPSTDQGRASAVTDLLAQDIAAHEVGLTDPADLEAAELDAAALDADDYEFDQQDSLDEPGPTPRRPLATPAADESLNRLMDHANSEMGGEDTRRRQSAIAHLKAAVAATAADRGTAAQDRAETTRMDAYRNDLDRVVRPRRPVSDGTSTARPEAPVEPAQRPTPLVLVSAQRIDRTPQANVTADTTSRVVTPVRPRRVSAVSAEAAPASAAAHASVMQSVDHDELEADEILSPDEQANVFADATSFQDFADQLGASALPDLLEAAAVYCAEVLQRPEFSRPLVMRQIAGLPGQSATAREDYLRGFGTLLRQGRIAKVKRGMFALTDRSPYLAEARKQAS